MKTYEVKVWDNGTKEWVLNNKRHREDGPAVEWADGSKSWYINGKRHREDGPAVEFASGTEDWYLDGVFMTKEEHHKATNPTCDGQEIEIDGVTYVLKAK